MIYIHVLMHTLPYAIATIQAQGHALAKTHDINQSCFAVSLLLRSWAKVILESGSMQSGAIEHEGQFHLSVKANELLTHAHSFLIIALSDLSQLYPQDIKLTIKQKTEE